MKHFAHYIKRKVVEVAYCSPDDPWFAENQPDEQGFTCPSYHVTRKRYGPASRIEKGDTIWVFSQLHAPWGSLPPSLDAKIVVSGIELRTNEKDGKPIFRFDASQDSKWFPIYDSQTTLMKLRTVNGKGQSVPLLSYNHQHVGQALQSIREISDATPLYNLEEHLGALKFEFVSYRLIDGTRKAYDLCVRLAREGKPFFWDRWSLPRRMAERREFLSNSALDDYISEQIIKCSTVWGVITPKYGETKSYSHKEKSLALDLGKFSPIKVCGEAEETESE